MRNMRWKSDENTRRIGAIFILEKEYDLNGYKLYVKLVLNDIWHMKNRVILINENGATVSWFDSELIERQTVDAPISQYNSILQLRSLLICKHRDVRPMSMHACIQ